MTDGDEMAAVFGPDYAIDGTTMRFATLSPSGTSAVPVVADDAYAVVHVKYTETIGAFSDVP
jgi:hypothetical protein